MFLSDISIKRPIMISMILVVFVLFGALAFFGMNLELTPEINFPMITVQTIYAGAGPQELETQISKKIEDVVASVSGIDYIQSYSMESVSFVMISFIMEKDVYLALQEIKDKVDGIKNDLPADSDPPIVQRYNPTVHSVVDIIFSGPLTATELYDIADKQLKNRLSQVADVANVVVTGGQEREIRIEFDNKTVLQHSIPLAQIAQMLAAQNMDMPGGTFERKTQDYSVRLKGEYASVDEIRELQIPTASGVKKLGDLAKIEDSGAKVREKTTFYNNKTKSGKDNVIQLSLMKTSDGNAVNIYKGVQEILPEIEASLPAGCSLDIINESASMVESSVSDTLTNIILGVILTSLVLFFFLHDYKSTIIVALSMPMSIISTFMFMQWAGYTMNLMSLMGLSTAVGVLVTNSVVVLENIFRHKSLGESRVNSASKGTAEITVAVLASTLTNLVVFLPLGTMSSIAGQFFKQFSMTVVFATIFSLIMSFTLTPMLASIILPDHDRKKHPIGEKLEKIFTSWEIFYKKVLQSLLTNKFRGSMVIVISVLLFFASLFVGGKIGFEFVPEMDQSLIQVLVELPVGYKLDETYNVTKEIESRINTHSEVAYSWTQLGRLNETNIGVNMALLHVKLVDAIERNFTTEEMAGLFIKDVADIPNAEIRISPLSGMGGGSSDVEFSLTGQDMAVLESMSSKMLEQIKPIPGVMNLKSSSTPGKPEISIVPDRKKLAETGLTIAEVAMALRSGVAGMVTTYFKDKGEEYDIRVVMNDASVDSPEKIGSLTVTGASGTFRLEQIADIHFTEGYNKIEHLDRKKSITISCDVAEGYVMGDIMNEIDIVAKNMEFPSGYDLEYGGMSKEMGKAMTEIGRAFLIAILLTYMLLAAILESFTQPLLILGTIPLAMIGVFAGLAMSGLSMNIISMLAIVMLIGIVVNNAILILDYTNILVREQKKSVHDALIEAGPTKLKPILMSTLAIILGMLPMAMGLGSAGREMRQPMGVVSIGGLVVSSILSLIVIPVLYNIVTRNKAAHKTN